VNKEYPPTPLYVWAVGMDCARGRACDHIYMSMVWHGLAGMGVLAWAGIERRVRGVLVRCTSPHLTASQRSGTVFPFSSLMFTICR
jgi:hypothetical protein